MIEIKGDIWEVPGDWRVIPTNGYVNQKGECVMGRGLALQAKQRYPSLPKHLGYLIKEWGNQVYACPEHGHLISFPVKHNWWERGDIELIRNSCIELVQMVDACFRLDVQILIPRVGCGNGKLRWEDVEPVLDEHLDYRFVVVSNDH